MSLRKLLSTATALLLALLVIQLLMPEPETETRWIASWKDNPRSVEEVTELANRIVRARVVRVEEAEPLTTEAPGEPGGADSIPVEVVTMQITGEPVKGRGRNRQRIKVFHTGHSAAEARPEDQSRPRGPAPEEPEEGAIPRNEAPQTENEDAVLFSGVMNDPAYKRGEAYFMFLRDGPTLEVGGQYIETQGIVSPEGRFRIGADGKLQPMSDRPFAQELRGNPAEELRERAARAVERGRGNQ